MIERSDIQWSSTARVWIVVLQFQFSLNALLQFQPISLLPVKLVV